MVDEGLPHGGAANDRSPVEKWLDFLGLGLGLRFGVAPMWQRIGFVAPFLLQASKDSGLLKAQGPESRAQLMGVKCGAGRRTGFRSCRGLRRVFSYPLNRLSHRTFGSRHCLDIEPNGALRVRAKNHHLARLTASETL